MNSNYSIYTLFGMRHASQPLYICDFKTGFQRTADLSDAVVKLYELGWDSMGFVHNACFKGNVPSCAETTVTVKDAYVGANGNHFKWHIVQRLRWDYIPA